MGNISQDVSDADLTQHFSPFGQITGIKIYRKGEPRVTHSHAKHAMRVDTADAAPGTDAQWHGQIW